MIGRCQIIHAAVYDCHSQCVCVSWSKLPDQNLKIAYNHPEARLILYVLAGVVTAIHVNKIFYNRNKVIQYSLMNIGIVVITGFVSPRHHTYMVAIAIITWCSYRPTLLIQFNNHMPVIGTKINFIDK